MSLPSGSFFYGLLPVFISSQKAYQIFAEKSTKKPADVKSSVCRFGMISTNYVYQVISPGFSNCPACSPSLLFCSSPLCGVLIFSMENFLDTQDVLSVLVFIGDFIHAFLYHIDAKSSDAPLLRRQSNIRVCCGQWIIGRTVVNESYRNGERSIPCILSVLC